MGAFPLPYSTPEEYLEFDRNSDTKHEYLDGAIIAMAGGSPRHAMLAMRLGILIGGKLDEEKCTPFSSDARVLLNPKRAYAYPDFSVVCGEVKFSESATDTIINPSLIVEILSPTTEVYDSGAKASLYRSIPSLQDLLLIHQEPVWIEHHSRQSPQSWHVETIQEFSANLFLRSVNQSITAAEIYKGVDKVPSQLRHD